MPIPVLLLAAALASYPRWGKIELSFEGPQSWEPQIDVLFTDSAGKSYQVPGFYAGGRTWMVRFSADRNGAWNYKTLSSDRALDGKTGSFSVSDPPPGTKGRLEYAGRRFLKFREGGYWIKFGADEPENFLGKAFGGDNWEAKKRQIDYLASAGINSVYIMTHTLEGDENDVWPWPGETPEEAKKNHQRFDHAKLEKWREFFEYIQSQGIVIHLVLEDDSAWTGYDHARYYREMVARFGYLPALYFNFGEEHNENYSLQDALRYMKLLAEIDPFRHARAVHNVNIPREEYLDSPYVDVASIQTQPSKPATLNQQAVDWWQACLARRQRPLVVSFDEARPAGDRRSWWAVYLGGAMWESLIPAPQGYAAVEPAWRELGATRAFMESLPFAEMIPANHLVSGGQAFCLAQPGEVYALYLPAGGTVEVELAAGNQYRAEWFEPRTGAWKLGVTLSGGRRALKAPDAQDWAVRITKTRGSAKPAPAAVSAKIQSSHGRPAPIHLAVVGVEGGFEFEIVRAPEHGKLSGTGSDRLYIPDPGFTGRDRFQWRVRNAQRASNVATVSITANASGVNSAPRVHDLTLKVLVGRPKTFILPYEDRDGPGPYRVQITTPARHGKVEGLDNDITYTPTPGYAGPDEFEWQVSDGTARSNRAKVRITVR